MKIFILVTHLLGTGHLSRALILARAFMAKGHSVTVVSGGMSAPQLNASNIDFIQLPSVRSDGTNFGTLLTDDGSVADDNYFQIRISIILNAFQSARPDVILTELFPFGRRMLRQEFIALLTAAKTCDMPCKIFSSIRDILAPPSKPAKVVWADQMISTFYDGVLVHADPQITTLDQSWPVSDMLAAKLFYTGYVAPDVKLAKPARVDQNEIIVSAGGGGVGRSLFDCAVHAARLSPRMKWRILVGGQDWQSEIARLKKLAGTLPIIIEKTRPDFRQLLCQAACSVSMCGYNTALDLLQTGTPGVLVPFDAGGEVEQTLRAQSFAQNPAFQVLKTKDMTPESLLDTVQHVQSVGRFTAKTMAFDGANKTVRIIENAMKRS